MECQGFMNCQDVVLYVCMDTGRYQSPLYFHFTVTHEKETASTCAADLSWVSDRCRMAPFLDALRYKFSSSESIVRVSRASASMSPWSPFHLHSAAPMFDVRSCFPCVPPKILEPCPRSGRGMFHCAGIDAKHSSREPVAAALVPPPFHAPPLLRSNTTGVGVCSSGASVLLLVWRAL